jgi:medium-chain acyl-[acyl-carrier-protein] hydrolase
VAGSWLSGLDRGGDAPVRLFCFAHAGGGSRFWAPWRDALTPDVQVVPVVLPGRETRAREAPYRAAGPAAHDLAEALLPYLDRPFAFFGHSLGSLLAFETARVLARWDAPEPRTIFVSARRAPQVPTNSRMHLLPTEIFVDSLIELGGLPAKVRHQRNLLQAFLPAIRADYEMTEAYEYTPGPPLDCPVVACGGAADPVASPAELAAWREISTGPFDLRVFDGDHFYLRGAPAAVLDTVRDLAFRLEAA